MGRADRTSSRRLAFSIWKVVPSERHTNPIGPLVPAPAFRDESSLAGVRTPEIARARAPLGDEVVRTRLSLGTSDPQHEMNRLRSPRQHEEPPRLLDPHLRRAVKGAPARVLPGGAGCVPSAPAAIAGTAKLGRRPSPYDMPTSRGAPRSEPTQASGERRGTPTGGRALIGVAIAGSDSRSCCASDA